MKRYILLICASVAALVCFTMCRQTENEAKAVAFYAADEKPRFMDGDANTFSQWIYTEMRYPESAIEKNITGKVTVSFTIARDGSVTNAKIIKGADPVLDKEALRAVTRSPKWSPGKINGEPVDVQYVIPIVFENRKAVVPETDPSIKRAEFVSPDSGKSGPVEFTKWYFLRVKYPAEAKADGIMGRGKIAFEITETGDLENIRIVQGTHPLLDSAAIKVVRMSPKWNPATKSGVPIKTTYLFPYVFQLR